MAYITPAGADADFAFDPPSNAIDFDETTRYASGWGENEPRWISVDLGAVSEVTGVRLRWEFANSSDFDIETSDDGSTWDVQLANQAAPDGGPSGSTTEGEQILPLGAPVMARYVRLSSRAHGFFGISLWSFDVEGTASAQDDTGFALEQREVLVRAGNINPYHWPLVLAVGDWTPLLLVGSDGGDDPQVLFGQGLHVDDNDQLTIYACEKSVTAGPLSGVYRSTNGGAQWEQISGVAVGSGPASPVTITQNAAGDLIVADGVGGPTQGIWRRDVSSGIWEPAGDFLAVAPTADAYNCQRNPNNFDDLIVGSHSPWPSPYVAAGLLRSLDGGETWAVIDPPTGLTDAGSNFGAHLVNEGATVGHADRLVLTTESNGKWVTDDAGADGWSQVDTAPDGAMVHGGSSITYGDDGSLYCGGTRLARSTNNGATWAYVSPGGEFGWMATGSDGANLIAAKFSNGIPKTIPFAAPPSAGGAWTDLGTKNFGGAIFASFRYDAVNGRLYANVAGPDDRGVWVYQFDGFTPELEAEVAGSAAPQTAAATVGVRLSVAVASSAPKQVSAGAVGVRAQAQVTGVAAPQTGVLAVGVRVVAVATPSAAPQTGAATAEQVRIATLAGAAAAQTAAAVGDVDTHASSAASVAPQSSHISVGLPPISAAVEDAAAAQTTAMAASVRSAASVAGAAAGQTVAGAADVDSHVAVSSSAAPQAASITGDVDTHAALTSAVAAQMAAATVTTDDLTDATVASVAAAQVSALVVVHLNTNVAIASAAAAQTMGGAGDVDLRATVASSAPQPTAALVGDVDTHAAIVTTAVAQVSSLAVGLVDVRNAVIVSSAPAQQGVVGAVVRLGASLAGAAVPQQSSAGLGTGKAVSVATMSPTQNSAPVAGLLARCSVVMTAPAQVGAVAAKPAIGALIASVAPRQRSMLGTDGATDNGGGGLFWGSFP